MDKTVMVGTKMALRKAASAIACRVRSRNLLAHYVIRPFKPFDNMNPLSKHVCHLPTVQGLRCLFLAFETTTFVLQAR